MCFSEGKLSDVPCIRCDYARGSTISIMSVKTHLEILPTVRKQTNRLKYDFIQNICNKFKVTLIY